MTRIVSKNVNAESSLKLLDSVQALIEVERSLTVALEKAGVLLDETAKNQTNSVSSTTSNRNRTRARPLPRNLEEVEQVWAVARNLASRTSAPAGWNPNAPVVGFATPNPLPHQLRGGALGTLQLERAQKAELNKKKRQQEEATAAAAAQKAAKKRSREKEHENENDPSYAPGETHAKRKELIDGQQQSGPKGSSNIERSPHGKQEQKRRLSNQPVVAATMNLSDSSSSSNDDDSDSD